MFKAKRTPRQSTSDRDMQRIKQAHEILGLDFSDEDDARAFRARARNAFRSIPGAIDDETVYHYETYVWYARKLVD